jgi:signal transduction histidine kinase
MISNKQLEFVIVDQGIGIEKRKLENIFSTDPKISSPGTKGERGSGLGLSICKELIQNHSGEIWANSIVRKGSTFSFSIPQE